MEFFCWMWGGTDKVSWLIWQLVKITLVFKSGWCFWREKLCPPCPESLSVVLLIHTKRVALQVLGLRHKELLQVHSTEQLQLYHLEMWCNETLIMCIVWSLESLKKKSRSKRKTSWSRVEFRIFSMLNEFHAGQWQQGLCQINALFREWCNWSPRWASLSGFTVWLAALSEPVVLGCPWFMLTIKPCANL